ncbi:hypothetical protein AAZX31_14G037600 [Glycine max]
MHALITTPRSHKQHNSLAPKVCISVTKNTNNKKGRISRDLATLIYCYTMKLGQT